MDAKKLTWAMLGAVALACAACGPTSHTPPAEDDTPAPTPAGPVEVLIQAPKPLPDGPRYRIEAAVENVRGRDVLTTNGFWTVFHAVLGLGPGLKLRDPDTGEHVNAVDYICRGGEVPGMQFLPTKHGLDVTTTGPTGRGQGHQDQFIAEMAQWNMRPDQKFVVLGRDYTYMDFVRHTQMRASVTKSQELSWAVVIIGQYVGTDARWTNAYGEKLRFEDLVRYELDASVEDAACGGTHRLFGLSWAYHLHRQKGGKKEGVWKEIADKTVKYRDLAKKHQNADGTFSTDFFRGPGANPDKQLRINTTGHTLEWLSLALPDAELKEQWVQDAANALAMQILDLQGSPIEGGSLYHAVHGLLLYSARVYGPRFLGPPELFFPPPPADDAASQ